MKQIYVILLSVILLASVALAADPAPQPGPDQEERVLNAEIASLRERIGRLEAEFKLAGLERQMTGETITIEDKVRWIQQEYGKAQAGLASKQKMLTDLKAKRAAEAKKPEPKKQEAK